jgi:hypothetical protein
VSYWRKATQENLCTAERTEEHLDALLDYRSAAMSRDVPG